MKPDLEQLVDAHFRAEAAADVAAVTATFSEDIEHDIVGGPGVVRGRAAVAALYAQLFADLRITAVDPRRRLAGTGFVVDESEVTADVVGTFLGLPGGGRRIRFRLLHVFELDGSGIRRETAWLDVAAVQRQLAPSAP